jgi:hypothetical protein
MVVSYAPFDLPRTVTQGASTISFGYDGGQTRIRKTTLSEETLYLYCGKSVWGANRHDAKHAKKSGVPSRVEHVDSRLLVPHCDGDSRTSCRLDRRDERGSGLGTIVSPPETHGDWWGDSPHHDASLIRPGAV